MFLQILDELVLATELLIIPKVIDFLMRQQSLLVQFGNKLLLTPYDIPLVTIHPFPSSPLERLQNAVGKIGPEAYMRAALGE